MYNIFKSQKTCFITLADTFKNTYYTDMKTIKYMNKAVSLYVFIAAIALVIFMMYLTLTEFGAFIDTLWNTQALESSARSVANQLIRTEFLHTIANIVILVKAYKILISYAKTHHVNPKYLIEIAIIGSVLELLFNYKEYTPHMQTLFLVLALGSMTLYVWKHDLFAQKTLQK